MFNYESKNELLSITPFVENEKRGRKIVPHDIIQMDNMESEEDYRKVFYISDLHLDAKVAKELEKNPLFDVQLFCKKVVQKMFRSMYLDGSIDRKEYLIILGDISFNLELTKLFFDEIAQKADNMDFPKKQIIFILGNHELWIDMNQSNEMIRSLPEIIEEYKQLFSLYGITFLHNQVLLSTVGTLNKKITKKVFSEEVTYGWTELGEKQSIFSEDQILSMSDKELRGLCKKARLIVFGGLGFTGHNKKFNANFGLYQNVVPTLGEDLLETNRFNRIYKRLTKVLSDRQVIVASHTPVEDWSLEKYNPKWIYVNGHTHRNTFFENEERTVYSDNQVGYKGRNFNLQYFKTSLKYDIFQDYENGTYSISRLEYLDFNYGLRIRCKFSRENGEIYMLKNNGIYMFFYKDYEKEKLYYLSGGRIRTCKYQDIKYYYENMHKYSELMKESISEYSKVLLAVSKAVKSFGGDGKIHGSIIDIDYYNHIFINPIDGTVHPYYADNMVDKFVYKDVRSLLAENNSTLYRKYLRIEKENNQEVAFISNNSFNSKNQEITLSESEYVSDTSMYKLSRIFKALQYLTDSNVIREWREDLIEKNDSNSIGREDNSHLIEGIKDQKEILQKREYEINSLNISNTKDNQNEINELRKKGLFFDEYAEGQQNEKLDKWIEDLKNLHESRGD